LLFSDIYDELGFNPCGINRHWHEVGNHRRMRERDRSMIAKLLTLKRVIKLALISAFASSLSSCVPGKVIDVVPGSEDCSTGVWPPPQAGLWRVRSEAGFHRNLEPIHRGLSWNEIA
jgi:hypothetical protein